MKQKHAQLEDVAILWLYGVGCSIFAKEVPTRNGIADALGVKTRNGKDDIYYLECKASRSDLICKKQKDVYEGAIGAGSSERYCWQHDPEMYRSMFNGDERSVGHETCQKCKHTRDLRGDTGVDFYYIVVADGVKVEDSLYPMFGVINEKGEVVRKAKRMKRNDRENRDLIVAVAHVLVYKVFGKIYDPLSPLSN